MKTMNTFVTILLLCVSCTVLAQEKSPLPELLAWKQSPPLVSARAVDGWPWHSVKDPTVVFDQGKWHLFATVRGSDRSHAIVYMNFADWKDANDAPRRILPMHDGYFCAPQVFWYEPQACWYLICQASDEAWGEKPFRPAYSTTKDISDPDSWTPLKPMYEDRPGNIPGWIDFWVICDEEAAHLFFTANNGQMWRAETTRADFPLKWTQPELTLQDDIFEASHTYRIKGTSQYLTIIEAQNGHGWRYYKSYVADNLRGPWNPLAATKENSFASMKNVIHPEPRWSDSVSHGELIRSGTDESLEIDPLDLRFLIQGVTEADRKGKAYGAIPWQLGMLETVVPPSSNEK